MKGETGIEGESRITRSPLYFNVFGLRGKDLRGKTAEIPSVNLSL